MSKNYRVAIVGATGAVGIEMLKVLEARKFPVDSLRLLASARSVGKSLPFRGEEICVEALRVDSFQGIDLAFFSAGSTISKEFAPVAVNSGAVVVDNSSAFRMNPGVPLIVPAINPEDAKEHRGILANPNCTTAIAMMGIAPLHRAFGGVLRVVASSYQAVSGAGARAIEELREQTRRVLSGHRAEPEVFPHPIAFNVIPQVENFEPNGYSREEMKLQNEGRRILHAPGFVASLTCVRVPVFRAHSVAVTAQFAHPPDLETARKAIADFPGVELVDDPDRHIYPMPVDCAGKDACAIGRLRKDCALENALSFWVCGDQLLRGAALNAVEIAELLI